MPEDVGGSDCTNCGGRGHFRDPEDAAVIDERNSGWYGQCRDCLGSGVEPDRCKHGTSKLGRDHRLQKNHCFQCGVAEATAERAVVVAAMKWRDRIILGPGPLVKQLEDAVDEYRKAAADAH